MFSPLQIQEKSKPGRSRDSVEPTIQPAMEVGKPDDEFEREADAVADRVMMQSAMEDEGVIQMQTAVAEDEGVIQMQTAVAEDDMVQMQSVAEEDDPIQMQSVADEEEWVQMKSAVEDEGLVQMKITGASGSEPRTTSPGVAERIASSRGRGQPLEPSVQREMGSKMGADFSDVTIHTGGEATELNQGLGARAFTVGSDIYFNEGQYNPESAPGKRLLAHELTHTIQQGAAGPALTGERVSRKVAGGDGGRRLQTARVQTASVQTARVQRQNEGDVGPGTGSSDISDYGDLVNLDRNPPEIHVGKLKLPPFKNLDHRSALYNDASRTLYRAAGYKRGGPRQSRKWDNSVDTSGLKGKLEADPFHMAPDRSYLLHAEGEDDKYRRIGSAEAISEGLKRVFWDEQGEFEEFQVDHIVELQVSGWPGLRWPNEVENMELLNASANASSGSRIQSGVEASIGSFLSDPVKSSLLPEEDRSVKEIKKKYNVVFSGVSADLEDPVKISSWEKSDIESGKPLDLLKERKPGVKLHDLQNPEPSANSPFSPHDLANEEIIGSQTRFRIYKHGFGGTSFALNWNSEESVRERRSGDERIYGFRYQEIGFDVNEKDEFGPEDVGYLKGHLFKIQKDKKYVDTSEKDYFTWPIKRVPGTRFAGYLDRVELRKFIRRGLALHRLSPIVIHDVYIDDEKGLVATGDVLPTLPIFRDLQLEFILEGDDLRLFRTFEAEDFDLPAPFEIRNSSLTLEIGMQDGFVIGGSIDFGIDQVGEGYVGSTASTKNGFELEGAFSFDSDLFDPAEVSVEYRDEVWTMEGEIGIGEGKVRGVKNALIAVSYSENLFEAAGEAELDIPGIERGTMEVSYGEEGFSIGGAFDVSSDIPGIRGGHVTATVSKGAEDEGYQVSVSGSAQPDIPGINSDLSVAYVNGALIMEGTAAYSRGMLSGSVLIGATNRAIDDEGQPAGEPDDTMRIYGGGSLALQLTPWLEATAGVQFLTNGEMEVQGRIGLPDTFDLFPRREINRNLFTAPRLEIPLFAIPLGPRSIGLVAQIGGGLDFSAGFGPGQLRELYAEITYNPDKEEETTLVGRGVFAVPADAGLTLRGDVGLGISAGIASLTGGLELAGTLGLEGEATAGVSIDWSPQAGLELGARGGLMVNPKFAFDVNAFARGSIGIGFLSVSETWRHNLAGFEWGPDIQFGINFPINYREGEPFDVSVDDIDVIYPELNIPDMARGLASDIKDDLFDL